MATPFQPGETVRLLKPDKPFLCVGDRGELFAGCCVEIANTASRGDLICVGNADRIPYLPDTFWWPAQFLERYPPKPTTDNAKELCKYAIWLRDTAFSDICSLECMGGDSTEVEARLQAIAAYMLEQLTNGDDDDATTIVSTPHSTPNPYAEAWEAAIAQSESQPAGPPLNGSDWVSWKPQRGDIFPKQYMYRYRRNGGNGPFSQWFTGDHGGKPCLLECESSAEFMVLRSQAAQILQARVPLLPVLTPAQLQQHAGRKILIKVSNGYVLGYCDHESDILDISWPVNELMMVYAVPASPPVSPR